MEPGQLPNGGSIGRAGLGGRNKTSKQSNFVFGLVLVGLFAVSFYVPIYLTSKFKVWFGQSKPTQKSADLFPQSTPILNPGSAVRVMPGAKLNPEPGQDFLLVIWFQLSRVPEPGEKITLLAKVPENEVPGPGYAISLARESDLIRPNVYWAGPNWPGRWYSFPQLSLIPKTWTFLALSFHQDKYIGLHTGTWVPGTKPSLVLLGGHELSETVIPSGSEALYAGAWNNGKFRGRVGALGVFSRPNIGDSLVDILKDGLMNPRALVNLFMSHEIRLWTLDGRTDLGPNKLNVRRVSQVREKREQALKSGKPERK